VALVPSAESNKRALDTDASTTGCSNGEQYWQFVHASLLAYLDVIAQQLLNYFFESFEVDRLG
jgi:hypothetical protein